MSVVPPAQVVSNADQIAGAARRMAVGPVVADLNAVSLPTMNRVAAVVADAGCRIVGGSVSGSPPRTTMV